MSQSSIANKALCAAGLAGLFSIFSQLELMKQDSQIEGLQTTATARATAIARACADPATKERFGEMGVSFVKLTITGEDGKGITIYEMREPMGDNKYRSTQADPNSELGKAIQAATETKAAATLVLE